MANTKGDPTGAGGRAAAPAQDTDEVAVLKAVLAEFQQRDAARQAELERLGSVVQQLTQVNSIECILANGFEELSTKLAPLEDLAPRREQLSEQQAVRLIGVLAAMAHPDWSGVTSLPVPNRNVPAIGVAVPRYLEGSIAS